MNSPGDPNCEGRDVSDVSDVRVVEGHSGWLATSELAGTVPLYRRYNALLDDILHAISLSEARYAAASYNYSAPVLRGYVYLTE